MSSVTTSVPALKIPSTVTMGIALQLAVDVSAKLANSTLIGITPAKAGQCASTAALGLQRELDRLAID